MSSPSDQLRVTYRRCCFSGTSFLYSFQVRTSAGGKSKGTKSYEVPAKRVCGNLGVPGGMIPGREAEGINRPLGTAGFVTELERRPGRPIARRAPGRKAVAIPVGEQLHLLQ